MLDCCGDSANLEIRQLITTLRLPIDELGRKRADLRRNWLEASNKPLQMPDILAH
jgi:chromosome partitioning protein